MPKKGYKQTLEHIRNAGEARKGKLIGRNNPAYVVIDEIIRKQIVDLIYSDLSVSQISKLINLSKYIIKRETNRYREKIYGINQYLQSTHRIRR